MRSQLPRGYVRFYQNGKEKDGKFIGSTLLRLPQDVARFIDVEQLFKLKVDNDGIHLLPVDSVEQALPDWAARLTSDEEVPEQ